MIHYHGGPVTPLPASLALWRARHAFVSFARPDQIALAAEVCQSFALDNGAFTIWKQGGTLDVAGYLAWVESWRRHPGFDFALLPDSVEGDEAENDRLIAEWFALGGRGLDAYMVPVWHLHESLGRLVRLCHSYPRVAFGSSGPYATVGSEAWWERMGEAMHAICDADGRPPCKLHGLRMLNPAIFGRFPFASADSTNVAQNVGIDSKWRGTYTPATKEMRALVLADRIESTNSAAAWDRTQARQQTTFFDEVA